VTHSLPKGERKVTTLAQDWFNEGYQKGMDTGAEKGDHEARIAVVKKMLLDKFSYEMIIELTGISYQDLAKLAKSH
jgi:hypothetical protein